MGINGLRGRAALIVTCACLAACRTPSIDFTVVPEASPGGPAKTDAIAGRVSGAAAGEQIVLFAKSGTWWVQPSSKMPFTTIGPGGIWQAQTHLGSDYAALLVEPGYSPPRTADVLPSPGHGVLAVVTRAGRTPAIPPPEPRRIRFSGYEWEVVQIPHESAGVAYINSAANVWTDDRGSLHLRIAWDHGQWTCAEVVLSRSLGYGTYSFDVRELTPMEPGAVFGMFTWDDLEAGHDHREMDIELSQWGDDAAKNAQFAIQPYYVPANVFRFESPARQALTHAFRWEAGRVLFTSTPRTAGARAAQEVARHVFTSGVPEPGGERVHINFYVYGRSRAPQQRNAEVVLDRFEYLP
jgi:hypothetical protein